MSTEIKNKTQLITYPDSLGGDLAALHRLLSGPLSGLFGGLHILPFFPSSGDRGFAPITYREVEPAFGGWQEIRRVSEQVEMVADLMVNHISRHSPYFRDFVQHGRRSEYADMFLTVDKIWPDGDPLPEDLARIHLRKPEHPFSEVRIEDTGQIERVWTTFAWQGQWEQVDLDVHSPPAKEFLRDTIRFLAAQGIKILRLDAVGYVIKKPGTSLWPTRRGSCSCRRCTLTIAPSSAWRSMAPGCTILCCLAWYCTPYSRAPASSSSATCKPVPAGSSRPWTATTASPSSPTWRTF